MSDNREQAPFFIGFLFLWVMSWIYFSFADFSSLYAGIFLILWSLLLLVRMHWMVDMSFDHLRTKMKSKRSNNSLPGAILSGQHSSYLRVRHLALLRFFNQRFVIWCFLGIGFLALSAFFAFQMYVTDSFQQWLLMAKPFMNETEPSYFSSISFYWLSSLQHFSHFVTIALAILVARSFVVFKKHAEVTAIITLVCFAFSLILNIGFSGFLFTFSYEFIASPGFFGKGWGLNDTPFYQDYLDALVVTYDPYKGVPSYIHRFVQMGWLGYLWLYGLGLYAAYIFLRTTSKSRERHSYAFGGIVVLCVLFLSDLFIIKEPRILGLWFAGWSILSVFWMRAEGSEQKRLRMHQI